MNTQYIKWYITVSCTQYQTMSEIMFTDGQGGMYEKRHDAVGTADSPEDVGMIVVPSEGLRELDWLTNAHDAEIGMEVAIENQHGVERHEIDDIALAPEFLLIQFHTPEGTCQKYTAEEINDSPNMVVV